MQSHKNFENRLNIPEEIKGRIPTIRVIAMPADTNPFGDIFGGWLLSQMDLAGGVHSYKYIRSRVVTVGIDAMTFYKPVFVGDEVSMYTEIIKTGKTSITVKIESWAFRRDGANYVKVTEGLFTYVRINNNREPILLEEDFL
jgi:acyl-CoA thioesterase YciA